MKFLCPKCERLVDLRDFSLEGSTLVITCSACGSAARVASPSAPPVAMVSPPAPVERPPLQLQSFGASNVVALRSPGSDAIAAAADAAKNGPFRVPEGRCPKCVAPKPPTGAACPQCGLVFAQFSPENVQPEAWLEQAWVDLLSDWGNEQRHTEIRIRAQAEQALASVGRLYRLRLAAHPEDPYAQRGRDEVLRMALVPGAKLEPPSVALTKLDPKWKYVMAGVVLVLSLIALAVMARAMLAPE